jgi:Peptidase C10 family/Carboxypeptidase regulatory-like domain/Spi protease inhibitor
MLLATMAKRLIVYFLVLLLGPLPVWARPTTDAEARRSVEGWLALDPRPLRAPMGTKPTQVKAFKDSQGSIDYFVVSLEPSGFAIVSGDDLLEPIIAFAPQGTFDPIPQNPLYVLLNRDLPGRLAEVREKEDQARAQKRKFTPRGLHRQARSKWVLLQAIDTVPSPSVSSQESVSDLRVNPLVESKWSQGNEGTQFCYNYYTPYNYLAGCFATAIAQLLRHYSLPSGPVDAFPYTRYDIYVDGGLTYAYLRGGDGAGGAYDWANMVLDPDENTGDIERQAIGALTYDAGVAVHTRYTASGSGSFNQYVSSALMDTFKFGNARYAYNSSYSIPSAHLNNMINPNLDARFPVLLGIIDPETIGHEVIVDGYGYNSATLYHHLNLGWAGTADAWYNLPTISAGSYNFTSVIECIYNIFPEGSGEIISGRVLDAGGKPLNGAEINATRTEGGSYSATSNSQGIYALAKIPAASTYTITASKPNYVFFPQTVSTGTSVNGNTAIGNLWGIDFVQNSSGISLNQALDNDYLAFTTGGDASWSGQTAVSFYGGSSAQSGALGGNQSAWLQTTVVGPGTLSFNWKVSSEVDYDFLEVLVDNVSQPGTISGEVDWQQKNISVPAGSHVIKWIYSKDAFAGTGSDCGWVDKVSFTSSRKVSIIPALELLLLDN